MLDLSRQKTEEIKQSNNDNLVKLLTKERQIVEEAERKEAQRMQAVTAYFKEHKIDAEEQTVSELINYIESKREREKLEKSVASLIDVIVQLREIEQLNKGLLEQSMAFVQLTLAMIQPESQTINYSQKNNKPPKKNLSVFDSKA